jgi:hypothetical protein
MESEKVVTPVKTGVQKIFNYLNNLDSGSFSRRSQGYYGEVGSPE